jgi:uncharacterized caspase-like protein
MFRSIVLSALAALSCALSFTGAAEAPQAGQKYALLVGVRQYNHDSLPDLQHTENDVEELSTVLTASGFKVVVMTCTRGKTRAVAQPTAKNIRALLKRILNRVTKHDTVLVGLAGHGIQAKVEVGGKEKEESFFCPTDAKPRDTTDLKRLSETMIPLSELFKELEESGAGVKLLLVDACRNDPTLGRNVDVDALPRPPRGTAALFSCKSGERAFETPKLGTGHGIFFHHVIQGLQGKAKNERGEVTWSRLTDYVTEKVSDDVPRLVGRGAKQTPHEIKNLTGKSPVLIRAVSSNRYALLIGVNRYENLKALGAPKNLDFAENDALQIAGVLRSTGFAASRIVTMTTQSDRTSKLYPSAANIRKQVEELAGRLQEEDTVLVAFSGYEKQFPGSDDYFFCSADGDASNRRTLVSLRELCAALDRAPGKVKCVVVDSCRHQEGKGKALAPRLGTSKVGVLFACSAGELAHEVASKRQGVLSYFLCEGLRGAADSNGDGTITGPELLAYLQVQVPRFTKAEVKMAQTPVLMGKINDLEFPLKK